MDLYRPLYGVFENVIDITSTSRGGVEVQNIFAQVVASLVSMGYQVNQCIMDAWNFGSPQQRSRLIVTIAAPGLSPIEQAWHTHGTPENTKQRSLGVLPSGVRYGGREHYPTPFDHVPASTVGLGLPNIGNGLTQTCIPYPDHRVPNLPTWQKRDLLKYIPRQPPGCGYKEAEERGLIPPHLQIIKDEERIGKSYRRIKAAGLVPTITTGISVGDAQNGANIHSHEPRTISLLDARRTQGWSDEEPIIGTLRDQYRIVGNGVDRKVAFAVGLGLLRAVEKNEAEFTSTGTMETSPSLIEDVSDDDSTSTAHSSTKMSARPQTRRRLRSPTSSVARHEKPQHSKMVEQPRTRVPKPTSRNDTTVVTTLPQTLTSRVSRLSLSATRTEAKTTTHRIGVKRSRRNSSHDTLSHDDDDTWRPNEPPRKQTRTSVTRDSVQRRRTRHSGSSVEFVPKNWDKKVEVEYRGYEWRHGDFT